MKKYIGILIIHNRKWNFLFYYDGVLYAKVNIIVGIRIVSKLPRTILVVLILYKVHFYLWKISLYFIIYIHIITITIYNTYPIIGAVLYLHF